MNIKLSSKESSVIRLRYGIGIGEGMTYAEIAEIIGISQTMVRQHEHRGIRKLRSISNRKFMRDIRESVEMLNLGKYIPKVC